MKEEIQQIRSKLGISQMELAYYLETSETSIAMAESSGRSLPTKPLIQLDWLIISLLKIEEHPLPNETPTVWPWVIVENEQEIARCARRYKRTAASLQRKIQSLQKRAAKAQEAMDYIQALQKELPISETHKHTCLQQFFDSAARTWQLNGPHNQQLLQLQITLFKAMAEQTFQLLATIKTPTS